MSLGLRTPFRKVIPAKLSNETTFKMDSTCFDMHSFVGKSKGTLLAVTNLQRDSRPRYTHISSVNKGIPEKNMNNHVNFLNFHGTY